MNDESTTALRWQTKTYDQLSKNELFAILQIRQAVFVVEQTCAYPDIDALDKQAWHMSAWTTEGEIAAYARVLAPGLSYPQPSMGRVLTTEIVRGQGLGQELTRRALAFIAQQYPGQPIKIGAQLHLEQFYKNLGFESCSDPYDEDGIPHIQMIRN